MKRATMNERPPANQQSLHGQRRSTGASGSRGDGSAPRFGAGGDANAASALYALLDQDLRRFARARLRGHRTMTLLNTTALVHEAYLKLVDAQSLSLDDRGHVLAYAARAMRSVVVDFARARNAERRGGGAQHGSIDTAIEASLAAAPENDVLRIHEALDVLAKADERLAQVVELRYFGGLGENEIAGLLDRSERTVRDRDEGRLLLFAALE